MGIREIFWFEPKQVDNTPGVRFDAKQEIFQLLVWWEVKRFTRCPISAENILWAEAVKRMLNWELVKTLTQDQVNAFMALNPYHRATRLDSQAIRN